MKESRRKFLSVLLLGLFFFIFPSISFAAVVSINGAAVDFSEAEGMPFLDAANRIQVPLRATMEAAGCEVRWDEENQTAIVIKNGITLRIPIGQPYIIRENAVIENESKAVMKDGRIYLPIRAVFEAFGGDVEWDSSSGTVVVSLLEKENLSGNGKGEETPLTSKEIAALVSPAVFYMEVFQTREDYANHYPGSLGSGFFITANGIAVTNYHVVKNAAVAMITTTEGKQYRVSEVLYYDEIADYAVIRVSGHSLMGEETEVFPYLETRDSSQLENGEVIYTIGSPLGLQNSISNGIISNRDRTDGDCRLIQITAPISPGSSGGALIDEYGNAVGITMGSLTDGQNINLAIPLDQILMKNLSAKGIPFEQMYEKEFLKSLESAGKGLLEMPVQEKNPSLRENYEEIEDGQTVIGSFSSWDNRDYYCFVTPVPVYGEIVAGEYPGLEGSGLIAKDSGLGLTLNVTLDQTPGNSLKTGRRFVLDGKSQVKLSKTRLEPGIHYIQVFQNGEDFSQWEGKQYYMYLKLSPASDAGK